ncbi:MAG: DUF1493 family protein [Tannerella sp.]|nr:DUF1493 family protein [Tannerella sp.]
MKDISSIGDINADSDIFKLGFAGDDFHEMIYDYAAKYAVDMTGYLWYFHADEEGLSGIGGLFFPPPYKRVERISLTPQLLADIANKGKWDLEYPEHEIPVKRYDLIINQALLGLVLLLGILSIIVSVFG